MMNALKMLMLACVVVGTSADLRGSGSEEVRIPEFGAAVKDPPPGE